LLKINNVIFLDEPIVKINDLTHANYLNRVKDGTTTEENFNKLKKWFINSPIGDPFKKINVRNNSVKMQTKNLVIKKLKLTIIELSLKIDISN